MINSVALTGRLTKEPELRYTPNGVAVANLTLAVQRSFTNEQGEREADFIQCVIWRKQAETLANYIHKGSLIGIEGRLQSRSWEGEDEQMHYVTEVLINQFSFLESKSEDGKPSTKNSSANKRQYKRK